MGKKTTHQFTILDTEAGDEFRGTWSHAAPLRAQLMRIALAHGIGGYSKTRVEIRINDDPVLRTRVDVHSPADTRFFSLADVDLATHVRQVHEFLKGQLETPGNPYRVTEENVRDAERALQACFDADAQETQRRLDEERDAAAEAAQGWLVD